MDDKEKKIRLWALDFGRRESKVSSKEKTLEVEGNTFESAHKLVTGLV